MCTVTFLPTGPDEFLFTSNRDESPLRIASTIQQVISGGKLLLYPQDSLAKGTWIAVSDHNQLVCILNGAFQRHRHRPPYRLSRGVMALQFFQFDDAKQFAQSFDFQGMEPFTMVVYDQGQLYDLRWDEQKLHLRELPVAEPHLWSSPTLYDQNWQAKRQEWFQDWLQQQSSFTSEDILHFHHTGGEGDPENDLIMNRLNMVRTTSITHIVKNHRDITLRYKGLLTNKTEQQHLPLSNA